jgi:hypothetical protein
MARIIIRLCGRWGAGGCSSSCCSPRLRTRRIVAVMPCLVICWGKAGFFIPAKVGKMVGKSKPHYSLGKMVGAVRFELTTSCTRNKRASQATLRPEPEPQHCLPDAGNQQGILALSIHAPPSACSSFWHPVSHSVSAWPSTANRSIAPDNSVSPSSGWPSPSTGWKPGAVPVAARRPQSGLARPRKPPANRDRAFQPDCRCRSNPGCLSTGRCQTKRKF